MTKVPRIARPQIVVTADDFGLSPKVDSGILEAYRCGGISSTVLLVNFPDVSDSVARLRQAQGLEVGIHLNLTAGPPVLSPKQIPSLVRADGNFHGFTSFFGRVALRRIDWGEVYREWEAQLKRGLGLGCEFTFLTSHQHVHMVPEAAGCFASLADKFGVRAARLSAFRLKDMLSPLRPKAFALAPFVSAVRKTFGRGGVFCGDSIFEIPPGQPEAALLQLCGIIKRLGHGVHELVCHPGFVDPLLRTRDAYVAGRPIELAVLTDARLRAFFQTTEIKLTTYRALAGSSSESQSVRTQSNERPSGESIPA